MPQQDVPDHLREGLDLVIVGINPGLRSGASGHHYAFPGNHFWKLLYESGLLPEPLTFAEDHRVLEYGIGLTNLVDRTSREASELSKAEMAAGAESLKAKLLRLRPKVVCFNGMGIYTAFSGKKTVPLGLQEETLEGMLMFVVPSSSGRTAAYQRDVKLRCYRELKALVEKVSAGAASLPSFQSPVEATS
ncbi:MAG: mismatch-specific DNA-glycosylase [Dehalococcoidia bacterium]